MAKSVRTSEGAAVPAEPWYRAGLRFECTQCGNCCTGSPGYVWVTSGETEKIAAFLGRTDGNLSREHLRKVDGRASLTEDRETGDCCFLVTKRGKRTCSIYPVRPMQCRTWPFWTHNVKTQEDWEMASADCPGMNHGKKYEFVQIETRRKARRWEDVPE